MENEVRFVSIELNKEDNNKNENSRYGMFPTDFFKYFIKL